mgnify:CR=1 FL=1
MSHEGKRLSTSNAERSAVCPKCSYSLDGFSTLDRCPECGVSILECLVAEQNRDTGRRLTSRAVVNGWPLYDFVLRPGRMPEGAHARGWVAIGPKATGGIAIGAIARGYVAIGAVAMGGVTLGAVSIGVLSLGSLALGVIATGALAIGGLAQGMVSGGVAAQGMVAVGILARGRVVVAPSQVAGQSAADLSARFFSAVSPLTGGPSWGALQSSRIIWAVLVPTLLGIVVAMLVLRSARRGHADPRGEEAS